MTKLACDYTKRPEVTPAPTGLPPQEKLFLADAILSQRRATLDVSPGATGTRRAAERVA